MRPRVVLEYLRELYGVETRGFVSISAKIRKVGEELGADRDAVLRTEREWHPDLNKRLAVIYNLLPLGGDT